MPYPAINNVTVATICIILPVTVARLTCAIAPIPLKNELKYP